MRLILFTVLVAISWLIPFSTGPSANLLQLVMAWVCIAGCVVVSIAPFSRCNSSPLAAVPNGWMLAAVLSSAMGLLQFTGTSTAFEPWISTADVGAAYANLRQRNQFATLTNIGLASLCFQIIKNRAGWAVLMAAALLAVGNAASSSRTGFLQLVLVAAIVEMWHRASQDSQQRIFVRRILAVAFIAYAAAPWALTRLVDLGPNAANALMRFQGDSIGCQSRLTLWSNVLHLIAQKPWLGWGWGELDYAHFVTLYPGERFCEILDNAHNLPLHLAVELGVPLAILVCGAVGCLVWRAKPWADTHPTRQLAWAVLALIGLHSLVEYPLWYGPFQVTVVFCVWMLYATPTQFQKRKQNMAMARIGVASAAPILIAFCIFVAWDYWRISQIYTAPERRNSAYRVNTLAKIQGSWLFKDQVRFAELATTDLTAANAQHVHELALDLLHFSPEPRVVEQLIESNTMLGNKAQAVYYLQRFKVAYPNEYQVWKVNSGSDSECCQ